MTRLADLVAEGWRMLPHQVKWVEDLGPDLRVAIRDLAEDAGPEFMDGHADLLRRLDDMHGGDSWDGLVPVLREYWLADGEILKAVEVMTNQEAPTANGAVGSPIATGWTSIPEVWFSERVPCREYLFRHPYRNGDPCPPRAGDGLVPRGKAVTLSSAGGVGKTNAIIQMAVAVATGLPWLGHFEVGSNVSGRVLLLLGEEDEEEVRRRLFYACEALELDADDRQAVRRRVVALPLAGKPCPLLQLTGVDDAKPTEHLAALQLQLREQAGDQGWSLVVLDPQARFAGVPVEGSTGLATVFVQLCEMLTESPGNPTVAVAAHSSKQARRNGDADSRGVTALTDGFRLHMTLAADRDGVCLEVPKNNYGRPTDPVRLERGPYGLLFVESEDTAERRERQDAERKAMRETLKAEAEAARRDEELRKVVTALARKSDGTGPLNKAGAAGLAGIRRTRGLQAMDAAIANGLVKNVSERPNRPDYRVTDKGLAMVAEGVEDGA